MMPIITMSKAEMEQNIYPEQKKWLKESIHRNYESNFNSDSGMEKDSKESILEQLHDIDTYLGDGYCMLEDIMSSMKEQNFDDSLIEKIKDDLRHADCYESKLSEYYIDAKIEDDIQNLYYLLGMGHIILDKMAVLLGRWSMIMYEESPEMQTLKKAMKMAAKSGMRFC